MLNSLYIKNFILIDQLSIDFDDNFSVFTGATGAGKSIFIDSLSILIGDKLTTSMIKKGADKAVIEGTFDVDENLANKLEEAGYDNDSFIVTREINLDGKSVTRLNQRNTTVSFIKECLSEYVDIHCQHDNQYLLNDKYHLELLDKYGHNNVLLNEVKTLYKEYEALEKQYNQLVNNDYNEAQLEIIKYQLKEIDSLNIKDFNEDKEIENQLRQANELEKNLKTIEEIKQLFENNGILDKLYNFSKLSNGLNDEAIKENVTRIVDNYYSIADDYDQIMKNFNMASLDEDTINHLNQRLFDLQRIKRKFNTDLQGLASLRDDLQAQIDNFENKEYILSKLVKQRDEALKNYEIKALQLTNFRKEKAQTLRSDILNQLKDLALEKAQFEIEFNSAKPSNKGSDEVFFKVSMNSGQPTAPLSKVASGGELSRLMLGLKVIFAKLQGSKLIVFDEIDTGVSGYVALNIGVKMNKLAQDMQVFAVTHLPAVAACGDNHYLIEKADDNISTITTVKRLEQNERIKELAILSSSNISETSLKAASELFDKAHELINK